MTIQESYNLVENLRIKSTTKSETKVYDKFLQILASLKKREFSKDDIHDIEIELDRLNLTVKPKNIRKHFKKTLVEFEKFLKDKFSFTPKGHYTTLYGGLGLTFGILFGLVFLSSWDRSLGISMGLLIGMVIGSFMGRSLDAKALSEGRVL